MAPYPLPTSSPVERHYPSPGQFSILTTHWHPELSIAAASFRRCYPLPTTSANHPSRCWLIHSLLPEPSCIIPCALSINQHFFYIHPLHHYPSTIFTLLSISQSFVHRPPRFIHHPLFFIHRPLPRAFPPSHYPLASACPYPPHHV